jgi:hypothetical protein
MTLVFRRLFVPLLLLVSLAPGPALGAAFIVPPDHVLLAEADAVALVKVVSLQSRYDDDLEIVTEVVFEVEEVIKGDLPAEVRILEEGGVVGNRATIVSGAPEFFPSERALVFLEKRGASWRTHAMLLGKFSFVNGEHGTLLVRRALQEEVFGWDAYGNPHREPLRAAAPFLRWLRARAAGQEPPVDYIIDRVPPPSPAERVPGSPDHSGGQPEDGPLEEGARSDAVAPASHVPPSAYTMGTARWKLFDQGGTATYRITGSQPGYNSTAVAQGALAAWTNDPGSNVRLALGSGSGGAFVQDGQNSIVYNSSSDVPAGAIGFAKIYMVNQHTYAGETFWTVVEGDVVMKSGLSSQGVTAAAFQEAVTHEVGHTIALRHSDQGTPFSNDAIMNSVVSGKWGATLSPYDKEAVRHVYAASSSGGDPGPLPEFTFTDDPIVPGRTTIKAVHIEELRAAVNDLRNHAGLADASWTDPSLDGVVVKAIHFTQLLARLNEARTRLGLATVSFSQPLGRGDLIRASHIETLRDGLR